MTENTREMLKRIYQPIISKSHELVAALTKLHGGPKVTDSFFNEHYHKNSGGEYQPYVYRFL